MADAAVHEARAPHVLRNVLQGHRRVGQARLRRVGRLFGCAAGRQQPGSDQQCRQSCRSLEHISPLFRSWPICEVYHTVSPIERPAPAPCSSATAPARKDRACGLSPRPTCARSRPVPPLQFGEGEGGLPVGRPQGGRFSRPRANCPYGPSARCEAGYNHVDSTASYGYRLTDPSRTVHCVVNYMDQRV